MKMLEHIVVVAAMVVLLIASYTDIKRRTISNKLTYPAACVGVFVNAVAGILGGDLTVAASGAIGAAVFFGLGYLMWYLGQVGGGDVGLFAAIGALLPNVKSSTFPFLGFPLFVVCFAGASVIPLIIDNKKSPAAPFMLFGLFIFLILF